jgi:ParB family chromosome partitioning protein
MSNSLFETQNHIIPRLMQKSTEWYTPTTILRAVRAVLGHIELDPASCADANVNVQASRYYDQHMNGLAQPWHAQTLWLNPPYCKTGAMSNQERWTCKLITEYEAGHVKEAILLVNAATETRWFQRLYAYPLCFVRGRIRFLSPQGTCTSPTVGNALVYFGSNVAPFMAVFGQLGTIVRSVSPPIETAQLW